MRAVLLDGPGPPAMRHVCDVPVPTAKPGEALIRVGIRADPLRVALPTGRRRERELPEKSGHRGNGAGQRIAWRRVRARHTSRHHDGRHGRAFDGGYADFVGVPPAQVIPCRSELPWEILGAVPEMPKPPYGSLVVGVCARPGDTLLIRWRHVLDQPGAVGSRQAA